MRIEAIRKDISAKTLRAMNIAGDELEGVMKICIGLFYAEYSPVRYNRTGIFGDSPEKGTAVSISLGAMIDLSYIDRGGHEFTSTSSWNDGIVFENSMAGNHGDYVQGGSVWERTHSMFSSMAKPIVISALAAAGL